MRPASMPRSIPAWPPPQVQQMLARRLCESQGARNVAETKLFTFGCCRGNVDMDDPSKRGAAGQRRINVSQEHECRYWAEKFGVSPGELKAAVSKAGPMVEDVARELGKSETRT